ncbi:P-loop containing nucleoside triphosphate hydrolase [Vibrio phage 1.244.A._10N.261.54.C3]|nr:P-loop containing nucleoside triphosphate hydrolase [Vibrio phage 1.244.A._10N.261.54.C3]AUR98657.1 P-loop containing nucleoside triphosphate hydrolase [Vibrio phage 1.255.O._10N.286.45.F1]
MILEQFQGKFSLEQIGAAADKVFPFETYNVGQRESIMESLDALLNCGKRHVILEAPTGIGKSVIARTIHYAITDLIGRRFRTSISTTTKGLQDQYIREDSMIHSLKGKRNYACHHGCKYYNTVECKQAVKNKVCNPRKDCPYVKARNKWTNNSDLRVTNSAMMVEMCASLCMKPENIADMIIIDECHKSPDTLIDHTLMEYSTKTVQPLVDGKVPNGSEIMECVRSIVMDSSKLEEGALVTIPDSIQQSITRLHELVEQTLDILEQLIDDDRLSEKQTMMLADIIDGLHNLSDYCGVIADTEADHFIVHKKDILDSTGPNPFAVKEHILVRFKPLLAGDVSEFGIYRKASYYIHMSATICGTKKYAETMGIPLEDAHIIEVTNPIPLDNRRIIYMPVGRMSGKSLAETKPKMVEGLDELIQMHSVENNEIGLIHTASYALAEYIKDSSKYGDRIFIGRNRNETMKMIESCKSRGQGLVVASPSMIEGYDLKGDLGRWQAIAKVPFGFLGDPLIKYVADTDNGSYFREAVLSVVQASGRVVRGVDDYGVTYILDGSFDTLLNRSGDYFAQWYKDAIEIVE